jgi:hypothetical protein
MVVGPQCVGLREFDLAEILILDSAVDLWRIATRIASRRSISAWEFKEPPGEWKYFHASPWDLGRTTILKPRIPKLDEWQPEDHTTARVCLTDSPSESHLAIFGDSAPKHEKMFVYATDQDPDFIPNSEGVPDDMPNNPYGWNWDWEAYAEWKGWDPKDKGKFHQTVKGCVPDAAETGEVWFVDSVELTRIGTIWEEKGKLRAKWTNP